MSSDEIRRHNLKTIERIENDLLPYFISDPFASNADKEEIDNYIKSNLTVVCIPIFEFLNLSQQPKNIFSIIDDFFTKFHDDPHLLVIKIKDNQVLNYFHLSDFKRFIYQTQKKYPQLKILINESNPQDSYDCIYYNVNTFISYNEFIFAMSQKIENTEINDEPLSQFEKFMTALNYVKQFKYSLEDDGESYRLSRSLGGIFSSGNICCVGYSNLFSAILNALNIPNHVFPFSESSRGIRMINQKEPDHEIVSVYLKDKKYDIDGIYFSDPTWSIRDPSFNILNFKDLITNYLFKERKFAHKKLLSIFNEVSSHPENTNTLYEELSKKIQDPNIPQDDKFIYESGIKIIDISKFFRAKVIAGGNKHNATKIAHKKINSIIKESDSVLNYAQTLDGSTLYTYIYSFYKKGLFPTFEDSKNAAINAPRISQKTITIAEERVETTSNKVLEK